MKRNSTNSKRLFISSDKEQKREALEDSELRGIIRGMLLGRPGEYLTFAQAQKEGGKVKKGEKSSMVVFWKFIEQEDEESFVANRRLKKPIWHKG